jgi:hypothetical protein
MRRPVGAAGCLLLLLACTGPTSSPTPRRTGPPESTEAPTPSPTQLATDAGWHLLVQSIDLEPSDQVGDTDLDASLLLSWPGPGTAVAPGLIADLIGDAGQDFPMGATVFGDVPQWVPAGFALQAEVVGSYPSQVANPVLHVDTGSEAPFHELAVPIVAGPTPAPGAVPSMPPPTGDGELAVPGVVRLTAQGLTVFHSLDGTSRPVNRGGSPELSYGGDGDYWQVTVGVTADALGSQPVAMDDLRLELFDDAWAEDTPDIAYNPTFPDDSVQPGQPRSFGLTFQTSDEPGELRLVMGVQGSSGTPDTWATHAFDSAAITAAQPALSQLLGSVAAYLMACPASPDASTEGTVVKSSVRIAAVTEPGTGLVETEDTVHGTGEPDATLNDAYLLALDDGEWSIQGVVADASGTMTPPCPGS